MNYRHVFHAGNICDVVKHAVLVRLIGHLRAKDKSFCVIDTHAGAGLYDLEDARALKTGEAMDGIYRLLAAKPLPELDGYYRILGELNPDWNPTKAENQFRFYPGSPVLIRRMLHAKDRLIACELHEEDSGELRRRFHGERQVQIHRRDGYEALVAFLPPPEKRGLALIDPPYEDAEEFARLAGAIAAAHTRWPQGMMMIWYPIKDRPAIWRFHEALAAIPKLLCAEFIYDETPGRLQGGGFIFINPPWRLGEELQRLFPALHEAMQTGYRGVTVKGLAGG